MPKEVEGKMVFTEEEKKARITPVKFKYDGGPEVQLNQAAAEILEKRGDGKILKAVEAKKKEAKTGDK